MFESSFERLLSEQKRASNAQKLSNEEITLLQQNKQQLSGKLGSHLQFQFQNVSMNYKLPQNQNTYTMEEVAKHNQKDDLWTIVKGQVYDITEYSKVHPGGIDKIMQGAGKDCTSLFNKYHPYLNVQFLLQKCCIGKVKH